MSADNHRPEELFDDLLAELKGTIDAEIADELATIEPDFPALFDELRRRDEDGLFAADETPELSRRWGAASQSGCSQGHSSTPEGYGDPDDPLFGLIIDARQETEADLAARRLLPVPPLPQPTLDLPSEAATAPSHTPAGLRWLGAALTVAAAVALLWGLGPSLARPHLGGTTPSQAQWGERDDAKSGQASTRTPEPKRPRRTSREHTVPEPTAAISEEPLVEEPLAEDTVADALDDTADTSHEANPGSEETPEETSEETSGGSEGKRAEGAAGRASRELDALETEAEALWRAGDRAGAEALLRKIIRLSRTRRRADLAYGDLFTITRQLHGREREAEVWREYLARFPRGRYADDTRASLCRRELASEARACWSRYMLDFPSGTHRDEAGRATDSD